MGIRSGIRSYLSGRKAAFLRLLTRHTDSAAHQWRRVAQEEIEKYWQTGVARSNEYMLAVLSRFEFHSLLELGCNSGPRLYAINRRWPECRLQGIDINPIAVSFGNSKFRDLKTPNVELSVRRIEAIGGFPSGSFDICFSWASLMYLRPSAIVGVLRDMVRIASRGIVLFEMHSDSLDSRGATGELHGTRNWKRNYRLLFSKIGVDESRIETQPIPLDVWAPGGGGGTCIIVRPKQ